MAGEALVAVEWRSEPSRSWERRSGARERVPVIVGQLGVDPFGRSGPLQSERERRKLFGSHLVAGHLSLSPVDAQRLG